MQCFLSSEFHLDYLNHTEEKISYILVCSWVNLWCNLSDFGKTIIWPLHVLHSGFGMTF